ncbi:MAG TPA: hypothetical protein ENK17_06390 [Anaerolineae bacterium]|nr:hypothetical protein [Anaerolineae bacterium]
MESVKRIPYGIADYRRMREDGMYYVDKTAFIPLVEAAPYYLFLIRPRRFGKTLWLSVLEHYYDINRAEEFAALFGDTYIGQHPTPERNSYLVLRFDFSQVNPDVRFVQESFEGYGHDVISDFLDRYGRFFDAEERANVLALPTVARKLRTVLTYARRHGLKTYLLIDEYDHFANIILSTVGQEAYHDLTHGAGFFRFFFNVLKGATGTGGLARMFITGVSPVTMDDVTSGFNIGTNISLAGQFNGLLGFREQEVAEILTYYRAVGLLRLDVDYCLETMRAWYDGYRFADEAQEHVFNSDMVLHFLLNALERDSLPPRLVDENVRIDYDKLRHLVLVDRQLNGNFSLLRQVVEDGETVGEVRLTFPLGRLLDRQNFISLLFYFGLLSFDGLRDGVPVLRVPNLTVRRLLYGYIREGLYDGGVFRVDLFRFGGLVREMAYRGAWEPVFDFLAAEVHRQTAVRDYLAGEKVIQGFLLAYLNITDFFLTWSERELGGGFADIYLEPFLARYPDVGYGYLVELKYIPRRKFTPERLARVVREAESQLRRYADDGRLAALRDRVTLKSIVLVYNGWELAYRGEVSPDE